MIDIPSNMKCIITMIWKEQDKAVQLWKELEEDWFKFEWKGKYTKDNMVFMTWYKDDLDKEYFREIQFIEIKPKVIKEVKLKRKKKIKQNIKKKK